MANFVSAGSACDIVKINIVLTNYIVRQLVRRSLCFMYRDKGCVIDYNTLPQGNRGVRGSIIDRNSLPFERSGRKRSARAKPKSPIFT